MTIRSIHMNKLRNVGFWVLQTTWCLLQNIAGALLFLCIPKHRPCFVYHKAFVRYWSLSYSMGMGNFIFLTDTFGRDAGAESGKILPTLQHEYGHTRQSLLFGPLYVLLIALPSAVWCGLPCFRRYRKNKKVSYYCFYTESWANRLSGKYFKRLLSNWQQKEK